MIYRAFTPLTMKTLLCAAAACIVLPSGAWAQTARGSLVQITDPSALVNTPSPTLAASSASGGDLASPVYSSIEADTADGGGVAVGDAYDFVPMPQNAQVVGPAAQASGTIDPNNGLVSLELVQVGETVTTTTTRRTELAANPAGSTQAMGHGWRLNALSDNGMSTLSGLNGDLGVFIGYHPNWEGSAEHMVLALPYADVQLGRRIYLSTERGLGFNVLTSRNAAMSLALDYRFPRLDLDVLRPIDTVNGALTAGGRMNLYVKDLEMFLNADFGVFGEMSGWDVELGLSTVQPLTDRLAVKLTGAVSGADKELLNAMHAVSMEEAAVLDVPEYNFERFGLKDMRVKAESKFFFTNHLGIYGAAQVKVLLDEVAEGPLVDDLGDAVQFSSNLGLIYRF
jgi:outer membrane scaffolding protein for murein synthesis (MipA/OmpV family)